jgi:DNA mismatch repair protein MutL
VAGEPRRVHVLPDDLANQIAAGEVVERPASVVKELVENAFDAGARRVSIEIDTGGVALVRVVDDGHGMTREDAALAVRRHATSKIASIDDLAAIESFGFRGEALPSIASVSRFALRTRRHEDTEGTEIRIDGGAAPVVLPAGCAAGTTMEVRDLFFNVPARRKFLRATSTESAHVTEVAMAAALAQPGVTVLLSRDGRTAREWLRAKDREERVRAAIPDEELAAARGERGPLGVEALLSRPERARTGATALWIFVNGRHVRDRALARAVAQAYGSVLEPGRYPVGVVYLDLPHALVDVNVHPQKAEVRFADGRAVADALYKVVAADLARAFGLPTPGGPWQRSKMRPVEETARGGEWTFQAGAPPASGARPSWQSVATERDPAPTGAPEPPPRATEAEIAAVAVGAALGELAMRAVGVASDRPPDTRPSSAPAAGAEPPPALEIAPPRPPAVEIAPAPPPLRYPTADEIGAPVERRVPFGALRYLAQVRQTFLLCEGPDGVYVLDQHAAAERVTFHRLRRGWDARAIAKQKLLFPTLVEVAASEVALVEEAREAFEGAGLDVEVAGATSVAVHAVPALLARAAPERLLRDLVGELGRTGERAYSGAIDRALATMACHGSLRAGDPVAPEEVAALLAALDEVDFAGHCPHGRPIVMRIGWLELEQKVGRR